MKNKIILYHLILTSFLIKSAQNNGKYSAELDLAKLDAKYKIMQTYNVDRAKALKKRFRQSIELTKLLYEKLLDLDHHFSGLDVSYKVSKLSNPHAYPEFEGLQEKINKGKRPRQQIEIPDVLQSNLYVSASVTLMKVLFANRNINETEKEELEKIACILDFTVKMEKELNTIFYETEYLKNANQKMMGECEILFKQCVNVIGYYSSLADCRNSDDWENVFELLDNYMERYINNIGDGENGTESLKEEVDLKFAIDRVISFLQRYNEFVTMGDSFYKKFIIIISNYHNQDFCGENLPEEFFTLKSDIDLTIEKFNNSYNIPELRGSKLKELMYNSIIR